MWVRVDHPLARRGLWERYSRGDALPAYWDDFVRDHWFLHRAQLRLWQEVNPCRQEYFLCPSQGVAFVSYRRNLDVATLARRRLLQLPVRVIGVPLSVGFPGYALPPGQGGADALAACLRSLPGLSVVLNAGPDLPLPRGLTLPSYTLALPWQNLRQYLGALRSPYRRRLKRALARGRGLVRELLTDNASFDQEMYALYLDVYRHSSAKLECLPLEFFRRFPGQILLLWEDDDLLGFVQLLQLQHKLIFVLGGFRREENRRLDLYLNLLLAIISYGLEQGCREIDFGQTADASKSVVGAGQVPQWMYVAHPSPWVEYTLAGLAPWLGHQPYPRQHHVLRGEAGEGP